MQSKVSMVMPCYNKVEYIGEMFDSILSQEWDNIELILVNDGSTDGTRKVIAEYEPRFYKRGYSVVIIDQENSGVCAAGKAGLERATGEYVCQIDSDDLLDPRYISAMANTLDSEKELDFCVCNRVQYFGGKQDRIFYDFSIMNFVENDPNIVQRYLMWDICRVVWIYMLRIEYLRKCKIVENYHTTTKFSHEPSYVLPLLANKGKYKIIPDKLYKFNAGRTEGHSDFSNYEYMLMFFCNYKLMCDDAIDKLDCKTKNEKIRLKDIIDIETSISILERLDSYEITDDEKEKQWQIFIDKINSMMRINGKPKIVLETIKPYKTQFIKAVRATILLDKIKYDRYRRIIGYGALGKNAKKILPLLQDSQYQPSELWDINGDGRIIQRPDFDSLRSDDLVLILAKKYEIIDEVKKRTGTAMVLRVDELIDDIMISKYNLNTLLL